MEGRGKEGDVQSLVTLILYLVSALCVHDCPIGPTSNRIDNESFFVTANSISLNDLPRGPE
jgi:hypothetical protein